MHQDNANGEATSAQQQQGFNSNQGQMMLQQQQLFPNQQFVHSQYNGFAAAAAAAAATAHSGSSNIFNNHNAMCLSPFAAAIENNFEQSETELTFKDRH